MSREKTIVLGVTGSIAAYKAVELASKLTQEGARVNVVMTSSAQEFVTPMTFRTVTQQPVVTEMFDPASEFSAAHIALAERADVVVVAPATANVMAKLACGIADDMLCCTVLATKAPVIVAPAMHSNMYENQVTQENVSKLKARGFTFVGPAYGRLVGGARGFGRFAEIDDILGTIHQVLGRGGDLAGRRIIISAGGTREPIDPVRVIGNRSSGKMGYAIAEAARDRGADVVLVSAPTALNPPVGMEVVQVETTIQMRDAIVNATAKADALIMAAAPADFRPVATAESKIKRKAETITLELVENPDILGAVRSDLIRVGFAAESENVVENATEKLKMKNLDLIAANDITATDSGFDVDTNKVVLIDRNGKAEDLPLMSKYEVAHRVLDRVVGLLGKKRGGRKMLLIDSVEITLLSYNIRDGYINIPAKKMYNFPDKKTEVELHIGNSIYKVNFYVRESHHGFSRLSQFFKERELEKGDKVIIEVWESRSGKEYRLLSPKEQKEVI